MPDLDPRGALLFARFAFPPNELGYCGPDDHGALLEYADAGTADGGLRLLAGHFDGAWPYLELIARANGITDPLDRRVVEAYWIGNSLLDTVDVTTFGRSLEDRFRQRAAGAWEAMQATIPAGGLPHHSFHVFGVYPWVGLLRRGQVEHPLRILDRCRIRWGTVVSVDGDRAIVTARRLTWDGRVLGYGDEQAETVRTADDGYRLAGAVDVGDVVALHWDWICDRLDERRLGRLRHYSDRMMHLVNGLPKPAPRAVLD